MSAAEKILTNIHQDLIDRCRHDDRLAQFRLYKLYYKAMYNTSLRIVNNPQEAEDIMQEAFLSAFEKIDTYREEVSFGAWLKRIVINRSLDSLRKKHMVFEDIDADVLKAPVAEENTDVIEYTVPVIRKTLEELPPGYRAILSLHLFEGYDHEEIADIMGISNATSRSQYARARQKLKELIKTRVSHG